MKEKIHPDYHEVEITCACGQKFTSKTTKAGSSLKVDICNKCHPFYSGKTKLVDTSGRVEKFQKKHNI